MFRFIWLIVLLVCLDASCLATTTTATKHPHKHTRHHHRHHHHVVAKKHHVHSSDIATVKDIPSAATTDETAPESPGLMSSLEERLVAFVHQTVSTLHYTRYKFGGTRFDASRGIFIEDCSDYVDHLLKAVSPHAFSSLANSSGTDKPTSAHYYSFFNGLDEDPSHYWNKIDNVKQLQPGDILVFRYRDPYTEQAAGHVMVVMNKPVSSTDAFFVRVADAAPHGHSQDTRPAHMSGIGIGTLLLKVNPKTGQPAAYAWKVGSCWEKHVNFAMARPVDFSDERTRLIG